MEEKCIGCGKINDATTPLKEEQLTPLPGSISICFTCGTICIFDENLSLRKMTSFEIERIKTKEELLWLKIQKISNALKTKYFTINN